MLFKYFLLLSVFVTCMTPVLSSRRGFSLSWRGSSSSRERNSRQESSENKSPKQEESSKKEESSEKKSSNSKYVRGKLYTTSIKKTWEFNSTEECKYRLQTRENSRFARNGNSEFYYCELMSKHGVSCNREWIFTDELYDREETKIQAAKDYCEKKSKEYFAYSLNGELKVCLQLDLIYEIADDP